MTDTSDYPPGTPVYHTSWGRGVVVADLGAGKLSVLFEDFGLKDDCTPHPTVMYRTAK